MSSASSSSSSSSSSSLPILRVSGVPEHFNYPIHIAFHRGLFESSGVKIEWIDEKLGTGALVTSLKSQTTDCIFALTEGLIMEISKHYLSNDSSHNIRLLSTYVESPLCWAISTGSKSKYNNVEDLKNSTISVSRMQSGSHLMSCVMATQRGWGQQSLAFVVKGSFENLRQSVNDGSSSAFLWENFTTKPFHDSGEIRKIGEISTPWPCFLIAARESTITEKFSAFQSFFRALREAVQIFNSDSSIPLQISERYQLKPDDAKAWYSGVRISASSGLSESAIERAIRALKDAEVLPESYSPPKNSIESYIDLRFAHLEKDVKSMRLYKNQNETLLIRLYKSLAARGQSTGPISYRDLLSLDQNHYHGTDALNICINDLQLTNNSRIINIGSSIGGPARYIAANRQSEILAVEIQSDLHLAAEELTKRCTENILHEKITYVNNNFFHISKFLQGNSFDAIVSWLTILHFSQSERLLLFQQAKQLLKEGGSFYCEDFYAINPLTDQEKLILKNDVFCYYLPALIDYKQSLINEGFDIIKQEELTISWTSFIEERAQSFEKASDEYRQLLGNDSYDGLLYFYRQILLLFKGGNVGGIRLHAKKK